MCENYLCRWSSLGEVMAIPCWNWCGNCISSPNIANGGLSDLGRSLGHLAQKYCYIVLIVLILHGNCVPETMSIKTHKLLSFPKIICKGPVSLTVFPSQLKFMEISLHPHLASNAVIATKFCTCHDSCVAMICAKMCCDVMSNNGITARRDFHRIWIVDKKSSMKRTPDPVLYLSHGVLYTNVWFFFQYQPDNFCRNQIKRLDTHCEHHALGCPWRGKVFDRAVSACLRFVVQYVLTCYIVCKMYKNNRPATICRSYFVRV